MTLRIFLLLFLLNFLSEAKYVLSEKVPSPIPREFRAAWVAHVFNIDWPSSPYLGEKEQKRELLDILDKAKEIHLNAIIFQVRSSADAMYDSSYEPWTSWISGKMGKSPNYDPLSFCIREAHKRGIEVHAWFNPFRALASPSLKPCLSHITQTDPSLVVPFRKTVWMDVSKEESRKRIFKIIEDVLERYDVDGIHFDDYFYPYPRVTKEGKVLDVFPDEKSYKKYQNSGGQFSKEEWRRSHVNSVVEKLHFLIKEKKPYARFGISPFGIWRPCHPKGIEARIDSYKHIATDAKFWAEKGWVDYLSPQLYWGESSPKQNFEKLFRWWANLNKNCPIWPGLSSSWILSKEDPKRESREIIEQLKTVRSESISWKGVIYWSMKSLMENRDGLSTKLKSQVYTSPALIPPMTKFPASPIHLSATRVKLMEEEGGTLIKISPSPSIRKLVLQIQEEASSGKWKTVEIFGEKQRQISISGFPDFFALTPVNHSGISGKPLVFKLVE